MFGPVKLVYTSSRKNYYSQVLYFQQHITNHSRLVSVTTRRNLLALRQRRRVDAMPKEALHRRQHAGLGRV